LLIGIPAYPEHGKGNHNAEKLGNVMENDVRCGFHHKFKLAGEDFHD
jgi:hypothetical protein